MDKNAIKKFAVWARRELIERVSQRAAIFGITAEDHGDPEADSINGRLLSSSEKNQRKNLISSIEEKGFEQVIEEVAYTWFNRFAALRFMEVNGYLPSHVRVFTNDAGEFKPQILTEAIHLELDGLNMDKVYELENANKTEELFKYLLVVQCNALNSILPGMFQKIDDYTELLLPDNLLREGSVIERLVVQGTSDSIPESDWTDQVQIIGWLYQYYNTEPKDKVFARPKGEKIRKEDIPAATQLFTPDWIVHYMVENSLGRLWLEGHPNDSLKSEWKYYLNEAEQEENVKVELEKIRKEYAKLKPEEIKVIDPCSGSGHILCVMFDVLVRIYEDFGYTAREAVTSIVENNLYGLDIDERAAQLSYFAVMMKARQYDRRFFSKKDEEGHPRIPQPHVYAIEESNAISSEALNELGQTLTRDERDEAIEQVNLLINEMHDAKEFGSLVDITPCRWDLLRRFATQRYDNGQLLLNINGVIESSAKLQKLFNVGETLSQQYDVVITNPPYLGNKGMNNNLSAYLQKEYSSTKYDLFSAFIEKGLKLVSNNKYLAMITQNSWMTGARYDKARTLFLKNAIVNMVHLGTRAFDEINGEVVQTVAFCFGKGLPTHQDGIFMKLTDVNGEEEKEQEFFKRQNIFYQKTDTFQKIPSNIIAYWVNNKILSYLKHEKSLDTGVFFRQGMATSDNNRFLKNWQEVNFNKIGFNIGDREQAQKSEKKWFPYNKGGTFRKWYGNNELIVNWENDGAEMKAYTSTLPQGSDVRLKSKEYYFKEGFTWSALAKNVSVRYCQAGFIFDTKGSMGFPYDINLLKYYIGLINSSVSAAFLQVLAPTLDFNLVSMKQIPMKIARVAEITELVNRCIDIAKRDWDSYEVSWDFKKHPLVGEFKLLSDAYASWVKTKHNDFVTLKQCEERINAIFAELYDLTDTVDLEVPMDKITIQEANITEDVKSFLSYAVGCIFGRYSLDRDGLVYAGGDWNIELYHKYHPDDDAIIPICDDEYFEDDIVGLITKFISTLYGENTLEDNLTFIAKAFGGRGNSRSVIRDYFINDFYKDHCAIYQTQALGKRPIYWLFDSGKKNGFKCLIYLHRYKPDMIARIRTDYIHEQQSRYRTAIEDLNQRINGATTSDKVKLGKKLTQVQEQAEELRIYEEKIHHLADQMIEIDLDDGVKVNYAKFQDVLAKIK